MRKRPLILTLVSLFFFTVGISIPVQIAVLFEHYSVDSIRLILFKITALNWLVMGTCFLCSYLSFKGRASLRRYALLTSTVVLINNYYVSKLGQDFSLIQTALGSLSFLFIAYSPFYFEQVKEGVLNQKNIWWNIPKRVRTNLNTFIQETGNIYKLFDLSRTGAFVEVSDRNFVAGMRVHLVVRGEERLAEVVRVSPARGEYPQGIGLKFLNKN